MAEINLKTFVYSTILFVFILLSTFSMIQGGATAGDVAIDDVTLQNASSSLRESLATQKSNAETLTSETLDTSVDADSNDLLGGWLSQGFKKFKQTVSGTLKLTSSATDGVKTTFDILGPEEHVQSTVFLLIAMTILLIVLAIIIQRTGVTQ